MFDLGLTPQATLFRPLRGWLEPVPSAKDQNAPQVRFPAVKKRAPRPHVVLTIGHSNRPLEDFLHHLLRHASPDLARDSAPVELTRQEPLTIASANALLAQAPSVKAAVDQIAFSSQSTQVPKGQHSALAVLSEEKIKL